MPTVSVANFENDELISSRLMQFIANGDQLSGSLESTGPPAVNGYINPVSFTTGVCAPLTESEGFVSSNRSPLQRNGSIPTMVNGYSFATNDANNNPSSVNTSNSTSYMSGSCTPPPSIISAANIPGNFLAMRSHQTAGPPPYSALTSPCLGSKISSGASNLHMLPLNGASGECQSLQNSPFYSHHYSLNGNIPTHQLHRQIGGASPGPLLTGGLTPLNNQRTNGIYQDNSNGSSNNSPFNHFNGLRSANTTSNCCPQRELFPTGPIHLQNSQNVVGSGLFAQDRVHYHALAQEYGFIVGPELERVKENSCRSTSQTYGRIAAHFRNRYGETEAKTKASYLQIGVRVPSKDHVSEIVGKGGQKIKLIREETGALITTPGEHEEHVFIIEAPPSMAMRVARHLATRAQEITNSKSAAGERRRGSTSSQPNGGSDGGNGNNSAFLLTPNGGGGGCSGGGGGGGTVNILPSSSSLGHNNNGSATNSPLHPQSTSVSLMSFSGSALRPTNGNCAVGGLFTNNGGICSLPNSPSGGHNSVVVGGGPGCQTPQSHLVGGPTAFCSNSSSNSTNNTPGNRVLLARGRISVPQEMVGKIIGTQGSIITTIQKDTGTEIKSPPKEAARGPNATSEFEISAYQGVGLSSNQAAECRVQQAKQLIGHLVMRQLERRASEEVEEVASSSVILGGVGGGNSNGGVSEDQRGGYHHHNNNNNNHHHHSHHHPHHHQMAPQNVSNGGTSPRPTVNWMWPDVAKMDSQEAREVLDRILAESKNKTRRAKELAVAAGGGGCGTSPTSVSILTNHNHSNPSMMNGCCDGAGSQLHPPPPPQLLGQHPSLYDVLGVDGAGDCTGGIGDPYSGSPYGGGRNGFVDDLSSNSAAGLNGSINHLCSPRTPHGFGLTDQISDVFISAGANNNNNNFTRAPGPRTNLNCDLWNSNGSASTATAGTPGGGGIIQPFSTGGGTPNTANLNMFFNASANGNGGTNMVDPFLFPPTGGSGVMLNDLASCGGSSSTVKSYRAAKCEDYGSSKNVFNFSGPMGGDHMVTVANNQQQVFGSDCVGAGLTSLDNSLKPHPDVVHHHHHQQQQQCHQSLSRRHSDWTERMTGTASELLSDFTVGILDRQHSTNITTNTGSSSSTSTNTETSHDLIPYSQQTQRTVLSAANDDVNPFRSVNFQLMKALDQLCITSPTTLPNPTNGGSLNSPNNNSNNHNPVITSSCAIIPPPGFEEQRHVSDSLYGSLNDKELGPDMEAPVTSIDPWSNESSCSNSIFLPSPGRVSHSRVIADSDVSVKTSLLRRIFNGTTNATGTTTTTVELNSTHISSIWSATNAGNDDGQRMLSQLAATAAAANSDPHTSLFNDSLLPSSEGATVGVVGIDDDHVASITARCGAIGEGRRRQPSDSTGVVATSSSLPPASDVAQSLAIASITEVA